VFKYLSYLAPGLVPVLLEMAPRVEANILPSWYTFNARYGFAIKTKMTIWKRDALDDLRLHVVGGNSRDTTKCRRC
jgi:hypothetical protein